MNLLRLLLLKARKRPQLTQTPDSVATPNGYIPYKRDVNPHASLDEGVERARVRRYVPRGDE